MTRLGLLWLLMAVCALTGCVEVRPRADVTDVALVQNELWLIVHAQQELWHKDLTGQAQLQGVENSRYFVACYPLDRAAGVSGVPGIPGIPGGPAVPGAVRPADLRFVASDPDYGGSRIRHILITPEWGQLAAAVERWRDGQHVIEVARIDPRTRQPLHTPVAIDMTRLAYLQPAYKLTPSRQHVVTPVGGVRVFDVSSGQVVADSPLAAVLEKALASRPEAWSGGRVTSDLRYFVSGATADVAGNGEASGRHEQALVCDAVQGTIEALRIPGVSASQVLAAPVASVDGELLLLISTAKGEGTHLAVVDRGGRARHEVDLPGQGWLTVWDAPGQRVLAWRPFVFGGSQRTLAAQMWDYGKGAVRPVAVDLGGSFKESWSQWVPRREAVEKYH